MTLKQRYIGLVIVNLALSIFLLVKYRENSDCIGPYITKTLKMSALLLQKGLGAHKVKKDFNNVEKEVQAIDEQREQDVKDRQLQVEKDEEENSRQVSTTIFLKL